MVLAEVFFDGEEPVIHSERLMVRGCDRAAIAAKVAKMQECLDLPVLTPEDMRWTIGE